jgi:Tfp pilus assembly protein PilF
LFQREADLAIQLGDWRRAETAYQEALRLNPKHYAPHALLAKFYAMRGDDDKSLHFYQEAAKRNPLDRELNSRIDQLGDADVP